MVIGGSIEETGLALNSPVCQPSSRSGAENLLLLNSMIAPGNTLTYRTTG
jgi:hypothetical protein